MRRYHQKDGPTTQNLADHSHGVQLLILHIYPEASKDLLIAAIYHDLPEYAIGDMPSPVKNDPDIKVKLELLEKKWLDYVEIKMPKLSETEALILKIADCLECAAYAAFQVHNGNYSYDFVFVKASQFVMDLLTNTLLPDNIKMTVSSMVHHLHKFRHQSYRESGVAHAGS